MSGFTEVTKTVGRARRRSLQLRQSPYAYKLAVDQVLLEIESLLADGRKKLNSPRDPLWIRLDQLADHVGADEPPFKLDACHEFALELQEHDQARRRGLRLEALRAEVEAEALKSRVGW